MSLRAVFKPVQRSIPLLQRATFCTSGARSSDVVTTSLDSSNGYLTVSLNRPEAVNALNAELIQAITSNFKEAREQRDVRGIIISSTHPSVLCSGLDLNGLYGAKRDTITKFWTKFQDMWLSIYTCPKPVVAAIIGHCPAGGVSLAASSDYRVMARGKGRIGLNESKFGLVVPPHLLYSYTNIVGQRRAEWDVQEGLLHSPENALEVGLVDELADSREEVLEKSIKALDRLTSSMPKAQNGVKLRTRKPTLDRFMSIRDEETEGFVDVIMDAEVQVAIGQYLDSIKAKSKSKKA